MAEVVAKRSQHAAVRGAQMMKVCAAPGDVNKFDDNCFCLYRCVSAADQMQFFADAPLLPNMRTQM
jgi:hypothetical protein